MSPVVEGRTAGGIPFGAASGLIYQSSPSWIQNAYATPYEIAEVKDFEAKYYLIMRLALEHDITFLGTPNPSTILKLVETVNQNKHEIIKDICDGTIAARCNFQPEMRACARGPSQEKPRAREEARIFNQERRVAPSQRILAATATHRLLEGRYRRRPTERIRPLVRQDDAGA